MVVGCNWAGNVRFGAAEWSEPATLEELQERVVASRRVRVLGAGHSFSPLADTTGTLLSLRRLVTPPSVDGRARRAWVAAASTYGEVASHLHRQGWALHNLASLSHVTVAGACATATHGSGVANRCLAAAVTAVELVRADGSVVTFGRGGHPELFAGVAVSLGALGVVTRVELEVEPTYDVRQQVWVDLPLPGVLDHLDELLAGGYSVSVFTDWSDPDTVDQVWVKQRAGDAGGDLPGAIGGRLAVEAVHPIRGLDPSATTPQRGQPGPWHERLPHFPASAVPSNGDELQSEWLVPRPAGADALARLRVLVGRLAGLVQVCEVRAVAADDLWLSPAFERDTVGLHFTWRNDPVAVAALLPIVETALEPLDPRPHWGKLFAMDPAGAYPRLGAFRDLADAMDPEGTFANRTVDAYLGRAL